MTFNVNTFKSQVLSDGAKSVAKANSFEVVVVPPARIVLSDNSRAAVPTFRFRTEAAELPGRSIQTSEVKSLGYGLTTKVGYDVIYPDVSMTILCGAKLEEKRLFSAWQSMIIGNHSRRSNNQQYFQSIGYYRNYVSTIGLYQYDASGNISYVMALEEAYPVSVNSMPLNWASEELHKLTVTFAYKNYFESDEPEAGKPAKGGGRGSGISLNLNFTFDDILGGVGLPRVGEIFNVPALTTSSFSF